MSRELRIIRVENGYLVLAQETQKCAMPRRFIAPSEIEVADVVRDLCRDFLAWREADSAGQES